MAIEQNILPKSKKEEVLDDIDALISSCEEGISGEWDCSPDGFEAMITLLERVKKYVS